MGGKGSMKQNTKQGLTAFIGAILIVASAGFMLYLIARLFMWTGEHHPLVIAIFIVTFLASIPLWFVTYLVYDWLEDRRYRDWSEWEIVKQYSLKKEDY